MPPRLANPVGPKMMILENPRFYQGDVMISENPRFCKDDVTILEDTRLYEDEDDVMIVSEEVPVAASAASAKADAEPGKRRTAKRVHPAPSLVKLLSS